MTLEEFFGAVETTREHWRVRQDGEIRTANTPYRSILGDVCARRTGQEYEPNEWRRSAEALGLTIQDGEIIHRASELILPCNREVRLRILEIIGRLHRIVKPGPPRRVLSKPATAWRGARPQGNRKRSAATVLDSDETGFDD